MDRRKFLKASVFLGVSGVILPKLGNGGIFDRYKDDPEEDRCKIILASFDASVKDLPINEVIAVVGKSFIGTPYVAGTLDENASQENLVIKVTGLDCVTFVENALIMSRLIKKGTTDFESYKRELELVRYRDGAMNGYTSRLHYFTDWIENNQAKGIVKDITKDIGGIPYVKNIDFMTTHTSSYKQLKNNPEDISRMKDVEARINTYERYYIPKSDVSNYYDKMQTGDIVATTTEIAGLDVTHTGYIYKDESGTHFMHANIKTGEVMITRNQLHEYMAGNAKQSGVIITRVLENNK